MAAEVNSIKGGGSFEEFFMSKPASDHLHKDLKYLELSYFSLDYERAKLMRGYGFRV